MIGKDGSAGHGELIATTPAFPAPLVRHPIETVKCAAFGTYWLAIRFRPSQLSKQTHYFGVREMVYVAP